MRRAGVLVALVLAARVAVAEPAPLERIRGIVHVHSDVSSGQLSLDDVVTVLERQGIQAVLLSDNYLLRIEYGLPPFRALTRVTREERSVLGAGLEPYLAGVEEVRRRHPRVLIVVGVEAAPHYFWTGSPLALGMTLHNTQKNLLVFGLDAAALRTLPVTGNRAAARWAPAALVDALPGLLVIPGVALLLTRRRIRRRLGRTVVVLHRRSWLLGGLLAGVGLLALVRALPLRVDPYPPWEDYGVAPYQDLIDHVDRRGGLTFWSFPEAPDSGEDRVGPVRVAWLTEPHADDLFRTFRYTGFGAVYEQPTRFIQPGGGWDRLLREFAAGERSRPAWAIGESGFHEFQSGKRLGAVQTVFLAAERSEAGVLDALRRGRMYALHRAGNLGLTLGEFSVSDGRVAAGSGELLRVPAGTPLEVRIAVDASDGGAHAVRVSLLRNGTVAGAWSVQTPYRGAHREVFDGRPGYYRLDIRGAAPLQVLTNPIFVAP